VGSEDQISGGQNRRSNYFAIFQEFKSLKSIIFNFQPPENGSDQEIEFIIAFDLLKIC
jgi:hypothetical protein